MEGGSHNSIVTCIYIGISRDNRRLNYYDVVVSYLKQSDMWNLEFFVPLENFSFIWKRHHYRWRAANFDLCSALMAIEQWGFFSVPHLLWHGAPVYNGHLRGPVTLTPIAFQLAVEQSLPVLKAKVCCGWESNTQPYACRAIALTHCATAASTCIVPYFTDIREYLNAMKHSIELCLLYRRVFTLNYRITQQCYKSSI